MRSPGSSAARGSAAPSTSSATWSRTSAATNAASSAPRCGRSSTPKTETQAKHARDASPRAALEPIAPKVCELLEEAEEDLIAFYAFPTRALDQAPLHEPARARQQRDRPPHRCRRHLPQRRRRDPPRRRAADRTERRMARQPPLPLRRIDGLILTSPDNSEQPAPIQELPLAA